MGYFYKVVVQAVLLYSSESWTASQFWLNKLRSFHHCLARFLLGMHTRHLGDDLWFSPRNSEVFTAAKLETIDEYINWRRDTITPYVVSRPIYAECLCLSGRGGSPRKLVWWQLMDPLAAVE